MVFTGTGSTKTRFMVFGRSLGRYALEDTSNYPDSRLRSYYIVLQSAVQRITDPFDESMLYIALAADHQTHDDPLTITLKS